MKMDGQVIAPVMRSVLFALMVMLTACGQQAETNKPAGELEAKTKPAATRRIRLPAVAGLFYPKDREALGSTIDRLLAAAPANRVEGVRALICPHAGYEFSGPTAATAYKLLAGGAYDTVIILAASHYALFPGASVPASDGYATPLGIVPVSDKARQLAKQAPFVLEPRCPVQRPSWSSRASKPAPAAGEDTPETWEHSVEVQVPFLQRTLKDFQVLPVIFGNANPEQVARALAPLVDGRTLVIASTDLSHYHPYAEAQALDRQTVRWICDQDTRALGSEGAEERACGRLPVMALLHLAKLKGWKPQLLDYRNSGDTAGDKGRVVGYAAVAFVAAEAKPAAASDPLRPGASFSSTERKFLLDLARQTLRRVAAGGGLSEVDGEKVPAACRAAKGCFVTLTRDGQLRGCIGNILPAGPLYKAVIENTRNAALRDPRFSPVTAGEAGMLHIEISVLSVPEPLVFASPEDLLTKLQPHQDGVLLKIGERGATFLPQVWEQLRDKVEFLEHLSQKAGGPAGAWRGENVTVSIYHAEAFAEAR